MSKAQFHSAIRRMVIELRHGRLELLWSLLTIPCRIWISLSKFKGSSCTPGSFRLTRKKVISVDRTHEGVTLKHMLLTRFFRVLSHACESIDYNPLRNPRRSYWMRYHGPVGSTQQAMSDFVGPTLINGGRLDGQLLSMEPLPR